MQGMVIYDPWNTKLHCSYKNNLNLSGRLRLAIQKEAMIMRKGRKEKSCQIRYCINRDTSFKDLSFHQCVPMQITTSLT